jgi:thioesterase domain-containing protein
MLDSHFLRSKKSLITVSGMLDIMLSKDNTTIKNKVKNAYAPIIDNSSDFDKALTYAVEWVNTHFDQACAMFNTMPEHSALHIGFTNSSYQLLSAEDKKAALASWAQFNVDVKFSPMNHFDLVDEKYAASVNQLIAAWLELFPKVPRDK